MIGLSGAPPGSDPGRYPALGFDPAPGVPESVDGVRSRMDTGAAELERIRGGLDSVASPDGIWNGQAAHAFAEAARPLPEQAGAIAGALRRGAALQAEWFHALESYQSTARDLEARAAHARRELANAENNPDLGLANQVFPDDESLAEAQRRLDIARKIVQHWQAVLEYVIETAKQLLEEHQTHGRATARQVSRVIEDTGSLWEGFVDVVSAIAGEIAGSPPRHGSGPRRTPSSSTRSATRSAP